MAWVHIMACALVGIAVMLPSINGGPLFDDQALIDLEPKYRDDGWRYLCPRWLALQSYCWTWRVFGYRWRAWHGINLILHAVNISLVYMIVQALWFPLAPWAALTFAVHPLQTSAVGYMSARPGILAATFAYTGFLALVQGDWPGAVLSALLSLLSKEDAWIYLAFWPMLVYFSGRT